MAGVTPDAVSVVRSVPKGREALAAARRGAVWLAASYFGMRQGPMGAICWTEVT